MYVRELRPCRGKKKIANCDQKIQRLYSMSTNCMSTNFYYTAGIK